MQRDFKSPSSSFEWYFLHEFAEKSTLVDILRNEYRKSYFLTCNKLHNAKATSLCKVNILVEVHIRYLSLRKTNK